MAGALIGALRVSLSAETSAFEAGMKRSQRTAQSTAAKIKSSFGSIGGEFGLLKAGIAGFIGALSVGSIIAAGKAALDYAGSLGETAQQLGVTTKELQTFRFAAQQNGASLEDADKALGKFAISISKAQAGSKQAAAAFGSVGVSLADLQNKSKSDLLGQIADKMKATGGAANNAAAGVAIFGRGFLKIVPTLDQGSAGMNELARAAEELGIVLSDSQIQKADETADKLDALQTVLKAQIAGVVADNADSILDLANAIAQVAREAGAAIGKLQKFYQAARIAADQAEIALSKRFDAGFLGALGIGNKQRATNRAAAQADIDSIRKGQTEDRFSAMFRGRPKAAGGGGNIDKFLAGAGPKPKKAKVDHSAEEALRKQIDALRDANQFDQDIRRSNIDILNAKRDLATDEVERYQISIDTKDAELAAYNAQLAYEVKLNKLTDGQDGISEAQAAQLSAQNAIKDDLERQKLIADENHRAFEESAQLDLTSLELERAKLESEAQLADTAKEQRDVQLRILDISYQIERTRLQTILADKQASDAAKEDARRRLAALKETYGNDRAAVNQRTRSPLEEYAASLPLDADRLNAALENVAVRGLQSLEDGLMDVIQGTKSVKEAFHDMAAAILADLIRIAIQKYIVGTILKLAGVAGAADGGAVSGFAYGGFVSGPGGPREDRVLAMLSNGEFVVNSKATKQNLPLLEAMNSGRIPGMATGGMAGLPIARTSYSARANVANDTGALGMPSMNFEFHNDFRGADPSSVAAIKARQDRFEAEFPGKVVATMQDAKERLVWRGDRR